MYAPDRKEAEVTAQFINGVGLSTFETIQVEVLEKKKPAPADSEEVAKEAVRLASHKLPVQTRFLTRGEAESVKS